VGDSGRDSGQDSGRDVGATRCLNSKRGGWLCNNDVDGVSNARGWVSRERDANKENGVGGGVVVTEGLTLFCQVTALRRRFSGSS